MVVVGSIFYFMSNKGGFRVCHVRVFKYLLFFDVLCFENTGITTGIRIKDFRAVPGINTINNG